MTIAHAMTDPSGTSEPETTRQRAGIVYAVLTAVSAAVLLFLPALLLGITLSLLASAMRGDVLAWQGSVDLTYTFLGIPALLSLPLLFIPRKLFRVAAGRLGARPAIRWVGGLLAAWHGGVALLWTLAATAGSIPQTQRPEIWYAVAFAIAAAAILIGAVMAEKRAVRAALAFSGGLAVACVALVAVLVSMWGSPPRMPADAQVVHVVVIGSTVRLDPATVHGGEVYFVVGAPDDAAEHASFSFVSAGYGSTCCDAPRPLSDDAVDRLAAGDYQGTGIEGGWGQFAKFTLEAGKYAFLVAGPNGDQPGVPPQSVTVLDVLP